MSDVWIVFLGGGAGSVARFLVGAWMARALGLSFPWGTFAVNVAGSFLLGGVMYLGATTQALSPNVRLALATGFCGGFTTYSTFNHEVFWLAKDGAWGTAAAYVLGTVATCLAAGAAGWVLAAKASG
ncbi:MAG: fluoride efflux transporter CrcB [Myxococcota bacterium]